VTDGIYSVSRIIVSYKKHLFMSRIFSLLLLQLTMFSQVSADSRQCRAEAAGLIAELRAQSESAYSSEAVGFARVASLAMCERLVNGKIDKIATVKQTVSTPIKNTFLGIPIGSSTRNKGHQRLKKIK
jgi:hypothetical protein